MVRLQSDPFKGKDCRSDEKREIVPVKELDVREAIFR